MLTYTTLKNRIVYLENLPLRAWAAFSDLLDCFDKILWDLTSSDKEIPAPDIALKIETFYDFTKKFRCCHTSTPGGDDLRLITDDLVQRLILKFEDRFKQQKLDSLAEIIEKTAEKFPDVSSQIKAWFKKHHAAYKTPEDLIHQRIDTYEDWSRSGIPKPILKELRRLARKSIKEFPSPCRVYPRDLSSVRQSLRQFVQDWGGPLAVAQLTSLNQGNLSRHLRASSQTMLDSILSSFQRGIEFPPLREVTENEIIRFQENDPSLADMLQQHYSMRLFLLGAVLAASDLSQDLWKRFAQIEIQFISPTRHGFQDEFLSAYQEFLWEPRFRITHPSLGDWLIESKQVAFVRMDKPLQKVEAKTLLPILLPLIFPFLPVQNTGRGEERGKEPKFPRFRFGREFFLITPEIEELISQEWRSQEFINHEWKMIRDDKAFSKEILQAFSERLPFQSYRFAATLALRWWWALSSEKLVPPPPDDWTSFCKTFSAWIDPSGDGWQEILDMAIARLALPGKVEKKKDNVVASFLSTQEVT